MVRRKQAAAKKFVYNFDSVQHTKEGMEPKQTPPATEQSTRGKTELPVSKTNSENEGHEEINLSLPKEREANQLPITSFFKLTPAKSKKQDEQKEAGPSRVEKTKEAEFTPLAFQPVRVEDMSDEHTPLSVRRNVLTKLERRKIVVRKSTRPLRSNTSNKEVLQQRSLRSEKQTKEEKEMTKEEADHTPTKTEQGQPQEGK